MRLPQELRLGLLELRSGLQGFRIFLACLVLGVAMIAAVGSLSDKLAQGMAEEGRPLLGGDVEVSLSHRDLTAKETAWFAGFPEQSSVMTLRAMSGTTLVEVKAVDGAYPLYGALDLQEGGDFRAILARGEVVADPLLFDRLKLKPGDSLQIGDARFRLSARIAREPDRIASGFSLGPRVLMSRESLAKTGLIRPGSVARLNIRLKVADAEAVIADGKARFPDADWQLRSRQNVAPQLTRGLDQLTLFLTLAGLTALITGGIGIANAVKAFLDGRRKTIAVLKALGASTRQVFIIYLAEVLLVASLGIWIGIAIGALVPPVLRLLAEGLLPVPIAAGVSFKALGLAALFGYVAVLAFTLWPVGRAATGEPAILLRGGVGTRLSLPRAPVWLAVGASLLSLGLLAYLRFEGRMLTLWYLLGLAGAFLIFLALGQGVMWLARRCPRPHFPAARLALANLHKPQAATPAMMLALGLGLTLFVALSQVGAGISRELRLGLPQHAPAFYFIDVNDAIADDFTARLTQSGASHIIRAPMLRGRIIKVKGVPVEQVKATEGEWALRGDRGITYAEALPENSRLVAGQWWPRDYSGEPLVSFTADVARGIGLGLGDRVTVNVLGREITARVASLREVDWRSLGMNFVMVFSPNTLAGAPKSWLVTAGVQASREGEVMARMAEAYPSVTAIRVRDALDIAARLTGGFLSGLKAGSLITLLTGTLVLMGALSGSLAARRQDAVILKSCGATRGELVLAFALEYAAVGLIAAAFAVVLGSLSAWALLARVFEVGFVFDFAAAGITALLALALSTASGLWATWAALSLPPAAILRQP